MTFKDLMLQEDTSLNPLLEEATGVIPKEAHRRHRGHTQATMDRHLQYNSKGHQAF